MDRVANIEVVEELTKTWKHERGSKYTKKVKFNTEEMLGKEGFFCQPNMSFQKSDISKICSK